jgi:hypothetical protein
VKPVAICRDIAVIKYISRFGYTYLLSKVFEFHQTIFHSNNTLVSII